MADALLILTMDPVQDCLEANNSAAWRLNVERARAMKYLILARNARHGGDRHGSAFLVARIADIIPRKDAQVSGDGRSAIVFDSAARIDVPNVWTPATMPVRYVVAKEVLGRSPEEFGLQPAPKKVLDWSYSRRVREQPPSGTKALTIAEAKEGLAAQFGCSPSAIEITIRA